MKNHVICAFIVSLIVIMAGCSQSPKDQVVGGVPGENKKASPSDVVRSVFEGLTSSQTDGLSENYSKRIPASYVKKYIEKLADKEQLLGFDIAGSHQDHTDATVEVKYSIRPVLERSMGLILRTAPERNVKARFFLVREDKDWRISSFSTLEGKEWRLSRIGDPELDWRIEKRIFISCLNAVMDVRVAEEQYRAGSNAYAANLVIINRIAQIPIDECRELRIESADENDYVVTATTHNLTPCMIQAGANDFAPKKYGDCPGAFPPPPPVKAKKPAKKPAPAAGQTL